MTEIDEVLNKINRDELCEEKREMKIHELRDILGLTIKDDNVNKIITFLAMLSAYTEDNQFNVSFRAPSTTGKSYIPMEISNLFPEEDLEIIGYASPTSFFHESGEWDDENKCIRVNLEKKILIFLDQPHDDLLRRIRPLLSHDRKEIVCKITDKSEKRGQRTKKAVLVGYPSVIFCTAKMTSDEQESTRSIVLSPETSREKIRKALYLKGQKEGDRLSYKIWLIEDGRKRKLKKRIEMIKAERISIIDVKNHENVIDRFIQKYPNTKPRHQRDLGRLFSIIKGLALFNLWYRERDKEGKLLANDEDIDNAFMLYDQIAKSQELGIPPYIYTIFKEIVLPAYRDLNPDSTTDIGLRRIDIMQKHLEIYGSPINEWNLRNQIIPMLESAGLISQEKDPNDGRNKVIHVTTPPSSTIYF